MGGGVFLRESKSTPPYQHQKNANIPFPAFINRHLITLLESVIYNINQNKNTDQFEKIDTEIIVDWSSKYVTGTLTTFQGLEEKGIIEGEISIDSFRVQEIFTQVKTNMIPQKDLELEDLLAELINIKY